MARPTSSDDNVYNSGIFVNSANALYKITGTSSYYNDAILAANHVVNMWPILTQDKPANGDFGGRSIRPGISPPGESE